MTLTRAPTWFCGLAFGAFLLSACWTPSGEHAVSLKISMNGDYEFNEKGEWTDEKKISTMEDLLNQHLSVVAYANSVTASEPSVGSKNIGFHNISFSCKGKFGKVQQYDFIGEIETNN